MNFSLNKITERKKCDIIFMKKKEEETKMGKSSRILRLLVYRDFLSSFFFLLSPPGLGYEDVQRGQTYTLIQG